MISEEQRQRNISHRAFRGKKNQDQLQPCRSDYSWSGHRFLRLFMVFQPINTYIGHVICYYYYHLLSLGSLYDEADPSKRRIQDRHSRIGLCRNGRKIGADRESAWDNSSESTSAATSIAKDQEKAKKGYDEAMNIYVITYERPLGLLRNNEQFLNAIRTIGPHSARIMERTWLVGTNRSPDDIERALQPFLEQPNDRLLINQLTYYQGWLPQEFWDWVNRVSQEYLP